MYRQGDVLIIRVKSTLVQAGEKVEREKGRIVLAYGEATGHAHAISDLNADLFHVVEAENDNDRLLIVKEDVTLKHEEHDEIKLPTGFYIVRRQREYSPSEIRTVAD